MVESSYCSAHIDWRFARNLPLYRNVRRLVILQRTLQANPLVAVVKQPGFSNILKTHTQQKKTYFYLYIAGVYTSRIN